MNKQDLKSLLENIYTALTEEDIPEPKIIPWIPPYGFPVVPIQIPTTPVAPPVYGNDPWDDPTSAGYGQNIRELLGNRGFPSGLNPPVGGTVQDWIDWFQRLSAIDQGRLGLWLSFLNLSEAGQELFRTLQGLMVPDEFGNYPYIFDLEEILRYLMANPEYWNT